MWICKSCSYFSLQRALFTLTYFSPSPGLLRPSVQDVCQRFDVKSGIAPFFDDVGVHGLRVGRAACDKVKWRSVRVRGRETESWAFLAEQPLTAFWFAQPQSDSKCLWPASRDSHYPEVTQALTRRFKKCIQVARLPAQVLPSNRISHKKELKTSHL